MVYHYKRFVNFKQLDFNNDLITIGIRSLQQPPSSSIHCVITSVHIKWCRVMLNAQLSPTDAGILPVQALASVSCSQSLFVHEKYHRGKVIMDRLTMALSKFPFLNRSIWLTLMHLFYD